MGIYDFVPSVNIDPDDNMGFGKMLKDLKAFLPPESKDNFDYMQNNFVPSVNIDPDDRMGYNKSSQELENFLPKVAAKPDAPSDKGGNNSSGGGGVEQFLRAGSGSTAPVKIATPQYVDILNKTTFSPILEGLLYFEQINGLMLLSLTNNANLDTENVNYQPIVNMAEVQRSLDPKGVLALQNTSEKYFLNFPIRLETRIPNDGNGPSGTNVYINFSTGNLVIESINLNVGEKIEIETLQNGTIYETDLGVDESW